MTHSDDRRCAETRKLFIGSLGLRLVVETKRHASCVVRAAHPPQRASRRTRSPPRPVAARASRQQLHKSVQQPASAPRRSEASRLRAAAADRSVAAPPHRRRRRGYCRAAAAADASQRRRGQSFAADVADRPPQPRPRIVRATRDPASGTSTPSQHGRTGNDRRARPAPDRRGARAPALLVGTEAQARQGRPELGKPSRGLAWRGRAPAPTATHHRGDAAAAARIVRRALAAPPRPGARIVRGIRIA